MPQIIAIATFAVLIVLGLACASAPPPNKEIIYTEVLYSELWKKISQVNSVGQGFIVEAYFNHADSDGLFSIASDPTDTENHWISLHNYTYREKNAF